MALFGYDQGVFGGVIITEDFLETLKLKGDTNMVGTVTSLYDVGCFFGAISGFTLGEQLGRKRAILLGTVVMMVGAVIQMTAFSVAQMIAGRLITGLGNGLNTASAPVWQSETSKPSWRGKLVVLEMILNIAGFSLANWMTYGFSFTKGSVAWRFPIAFQLVFGIILLATVPWLPESPRWLIAHGQDEEATEILAALEGDGATIQSPTIITEYKEIAYAVKVERDSGVGWWELLRGKSGSQGTGTIRRLILGAGTQAMQQLSGINVTSYYLPTVLTASVGLESKLARLLAACNSVSYLLFSFIAIPNVERWGRRRLMIFGAVGQCFCYTCITILLKFSEDNTGKKKHDLAAASVAFFFLYYVFFGIGWQGVPWLYPTEINSLHMRTKGAALGTATNWAFNYMVVQITPIGIETLSWKFYIIWIVFNASFVPIVYFFYPETAGRRLEDMDRLYRENHSIWVFKDKDAISPKRPQKYIENDQEEIRRASVVSGVDLGKGSSDEEPSAAQQKQALTDQPTKPDYDVPPAANPTNAFDQVSPESPLIAKQMAHPHASPPARAGSFECLETISVHYSPAEDPYWTELIAHYAHERDSDANEGNRVDDNENEDENKDAKSELLPFLLDDLIRDQGQVQEAEGERWPLLRSPDPVTVHHEAEALVQEFRGLSTRMEPRDTSTGIDVSILQKYRQGRENADANTKDPATADADEENEYDFDSEQRADHDRKEPESSKSARAQLLRDSEAIIRLLQHQNKRHNSDHASPLPHPDVRPMLWQTTLLRSLPPSPPPLQPHPPTVLSDPLLTNLWVRKEMQGRWTHKYHASLATERAALKARSHRAKLAGDSGERKAVASAKRKLHRTVVADCMREALAEIDAALRTRLREPLADIDAVAAEWKGLQCLALRDHFTLSEACEVLEEREQVLVATVQDVMPDLEDRLGAVEKLLAVAEEEMRKMRTRYARLCAWDVRDAGDGSGERKAEMERRLGRPEALVYVLKGWEDVRMVREMAWAVVERFEDMECGLGDLTRVGMEYGRAAEGGWLLGEVETLGD